MEFIPVSYLAPEISNNPYQLLKHILIAVISPNLFPIANITHSQDDTEVIYKNDCTVLSAAYVTSSAAEY